MERIKKSQPHREEHTLGERQVIILPQPLPVGNGIGGAEHQFIVKRCAAHPGIGKLKLRHAAAQQRHEQHSKPKTTGRESRTAVMFFE